MSTIRQAATAGMFYPAEAAVLQQQVQGMLAQIPVEAGRAIPKALIVPHAGYIYSGVVAAAAYARIQTAAARIKKVVLLGPCHRVGVRGLALPTAEVFATPLGPVKIDQQACRQLSKLPQVTFFDPTHVQEHSLEVHLPFLQTVLDDFMLVPLVTGQASVEQVAQVLDALWGGDETLIVISSDLSHYLPYEQAQLRDAHTRKIIEALQSDILKGEDACGCNAVNGLLRVARERHLQVQNLAMKNSGDTAGGKDRVVGYGAWAFYAPDSRAGSGTGSPKPVTPVLKPGEPPWWPYRQALLGLAAKGIMIGMQRGNLEGAEIKGLPAVLEKPGAAFVTLNRKGQLRGCIGSLSATRSLAQDVFEHAFNAAFKDPRFPPLTEAELGELEISLSVLSVPEVMQFRDQADLLQQLRPGVDGLIIASAGKRAVFLPSVWEQIPEPEEFLAQLKRKAGWAPGWWANDFSARRFITHKCSSLELADPGSIWK